MGINNKSKVAIGIITFLGFVFLIRAYVIYSFYKNDDLYGDGISDTTKYDKEFLSTVIYCILIMIFLSIISIIVFKEKKK